MGCCFPRPSHQQFGVTSSFPSTPTFSESHLQFLRDGSIRQFISSVLPQEARGDPLSISVHASMGASLLVSSSEYSHSSQAYSREIECFGRQPVSPRPNSPHRMVSRSGDISPNFQSLGYSSDRSFRHQIKPSSAPVCFSSTGPQGLCSGCYVTRMEKPIRIRISSIQTCSPGSKQDKGFQQSVHSHSPVLASEELVFSHFESHNRLSQGTSGSSGFGITTSGKSTPSESSYVASSPLKVVRSQIRGRHISEFATQCISQSRRESTLKVYSARWKIFSDWCLQREVNPVDPALNDLVDFFCYLFDTLKLSVASIKGYRSAISNTLKFSKSADCTADPIISDLIKGFALRKPVSRSLTPKWNLTCVLWSLNKAPYEPLKTADIKYITLKAVFLLTFAAARRSEIHALSIEEGCFRYDRNSDSITLLTQPGFLAKKQLPESLPEPIVIPGLSQFCGSDTDDRLLCPVRAVRAYLSRVKAKRLGRKRLFLPLKGSKDISPSTISRWICNIIKLAYADLSSSDLSFMKISAHEVRALSSCWAYWNSVALEDVVRAAYWRTNSTFSSFYLRDLAPIRQDTSSLGPLVAAQSITGCHRSVS